MLDVSLPLTIERELPICRVWQLGSRGRMRMLAGDWVQAAADADDVLSGPSAPLALTWPHLVRGLVALRRTGEASADLDAAWTLARRYGEPMRLLPAAAGLVEQAWLTGRDDPRLDDVPRACSTARSKPGLEWSRGELATWLQPARSGDSIWRPSSSCVAEPYRLELSGRSGRRPRPAGPSSASRTSRRWRWPRRGDADDARTAVDLLDRLGADAVAAKVRLDLRAARPHHGAGPPPLLDPGQPGRAHQPRGRGRCACSTRA